MAVTLCLRPLCMYLHLLTPCALTFEQLVSSLCVKSSVQVSIGNPEKMEPITNVSHIPSNRWALICCLCKEKTGACIQVINVTRFF